MPRRASTESSPQVLAPPDVLPGVLGPRLVALLAGMRHRVERPHQLAGDDVEGAQGAGRRQVAFAGSGAEQQQVLEDLARRARLDAADQRGIAPDALAQIDQAVGAERQDRLAGRGVDGLEVVVDLEDQPALAAVGALPVVDAAPGDAAQTGVDPQLLARRRIERDKRLVLRQHVHRGAGDDGIELVDVVVADRVGPRDRQAGDVLRRDLREVDELRGVGAAAVVLPLARCLRSARRARGPPLRRLRQQRADDGDGGARDERGVTGAQVTRGQRDGGRSEVRRHHGQPFPVDPRAPRDPGDRPSRPGRLRIVQWVVRGDRMFGARTSQAPSVTEIARAVSITCRAASGQRLFGKRVDGAEMPIDATTVPPWSRIGAATQRTSSMYSPSSAV